jgi:hypothetical protein
VQGPIACLEATATFVDGPPIHAERGACLPPDDKRMRLRVSSSLAKVRLGWSGGNGGKTVIYRNGRQVAAAVRGKHWVDRDAVPGGRYRYRVCPAGRMVECSRSRVVSLPR